MYVTDALQCIAENTTHYITPFDGMQDYGRYMTYRWADLVDGNTNEPEEDNRTTDEIVDSIWSKIAGKGEES